MLALKDAVLAESVVAPRPVAVTVPMVGALLLTTATVGKVEAQVTCVVKFCVELSENIPIATNGWLTPFAMFGAFGVISIAVSKAPVTLRVVLPVMLPLAAEIVTLPAPVAVASPFDPEAVLMLARLAFDEDHVTCPVRFWVLLSEKIPVATNCNVLPLAMLGSAGVTSIETKVAAVTVSVPLPDMP